jgi:predicted aspartyl protease
MSTSFRSESGIIVVQAELEGPVKNWVLNLALDTGSTRTLINSRILVSTGYDLALSTDRLEITTASGMDFAPLLTISKLKALGRTCRDLPVVGHTLPPSSGVDGLLGLDFLRGLILTIDFRQGTISLS